MNDTSHLFRRCAFARGRIACFSHERVHACASCASSHEHACMDVSCACMRIVCVFSRACVHGCLTCRLLVARALPTFGPFPVGDVYPRLNHDIVGLLVYPTSVFGGVWWNTPALDAFGQKSTFHASLNST